MTLKRGPSLSLSPPPSCHPRLPPTINLASKTPHSVNMSFPDSPPPSICHPRLLTLSICHSQTPPHSVIPPAHLFPCHCGLVPEARFVGCNTGIWYFPSPVVGGGEPKRLHLLSYTNGGLHRWRTPDGRLPGSEYIHIHK